MTPERRPASELALQQAVAELQHLIAARYPGTTFAVGPGGDDPAGTYLIATVDLDDPDVIMDLVIERVLAFQVEDELPVHVVPVRTPSGSHNSNTTALAGSTWPSRPRSFTRNPARMPVRGGHAAHPYRGHIAGICNAAGGGTDRVEVDADALPTDLDARQRMQHRLPSHR